MTKDSTSHRSMEQIETFGTPQEDETVLWEGKPDWAVLARTAFHTRLVAGYFAIFIVIALAVGSTGGALLTLAGGAGAIGLLYGLSWIAARTSHYILTDRRLILNIGMAIEKSINLPLKRIGAAHLTDRGSGFGDIVIDPAKAHGLGYALLWPHARPFRYAYPQPMLRAIPDVTTVAQRLAEATAAHQAIERGEIPERETEQAGQAAPTNSGEVLA